jgi:hypothetical protein
MTTTLLKNNSFWAQLADLLTIDSILLTHFIYNRAMAIIILDILSYKYIQQLKILVKKYTCYSVVYV